MHLFSRPKPPKFDQKDYKDFLAALLKKEVNGHGRQRRFAASAAASIADPARVPGVCSCHGFLSQYDY